MSGAHGGSLYRYSYPLGVNTVYQNTIDPQTINALKRIFCIFTGEYLVTCNFSQFYDISSAGCFPVVCGVDLLPRRGTLC